MALRLEVGEGVAQVPAQAWNALVDGMPLLGHAFLSALETSKSVGAGTGWQPVPLLLYDDVQLIGVMPLYVKYHSYGEYRMLCRKMRIVQVDISFNEYNKIKAL